MAIVNIDMAHVATSGSDVELLMLQYGDGWTQWEFVVQLGGKMFCRKYTKHSLTEQLHTKLQRAARADHVHPLGGP